MRWSDMDAFRHINNSAYLAYLEQARVAMFFDRHEGFSRGTVISRHEIEYLRPVVYHPEPLRLELWVGQARAASFTVHYEVFDGPALVVRAATDCVTFDFETGRPRRLTGEERLILAGYSDEGHDLATATGYPGEHRTSSAS
jgi:acyl-CoA thioester hydrolase